jgi:hypothetical protein
VKETEGMDGARNDKTSKYGEKARKEMNWKKIKKAKKFEVNKNITKQERKIGAIIKSKWIER